MNGIVPREHIIKVHGFNFRFLHDFELIVAGDFHCLDYHPDTGQVRMEPVVSVVVGHRAGESKGAFLRQVGDERPVKIMEPMEDLSEFEMMAITAKSLVDRMLATGTEQTIIPIVIGDARYEVWVRRFPVAK